MSYLRPNEHGPLHEAAELYLVPRVLALFVAILESLQYVVTDQILPVPNADVVQELPGDSFFVLDRRRDYRQQVEKVEPQRILLTLQFDQVYRLRGSNFLGFLYIRRLARASHHRGDRV